MYARFFAYCSYYHIPLLNDILRYSIGIEQYVFIAGRVKNTFFVSSGDRKPLIIYPKKTEFPTDAVLKQAPAFFGSSFYRTGPRKCLKLLLYNQIFSIFGYTFVNAR